MTATIWPTLLLLLAVLLSTAGAVAARGEAGKSPWEAGTRRAIVGLGLLAAATGVAAVGGALLGAAGSGRTQIAAFAGAAAVVALPLLVVGVRSRARRRGGARTRDGAARRGVVASRRGGDRQ